MKIFLTGATGIMGRSATSALQQAGHTVIGLARSESRARIVAEAGADPFVGDFFDGGTLVAGMRGCDAVCNLATHIPIGNSAGVPGAWRTNSRIRSVGSKIVVDAAIEAGVERFVQESLSFLYADQGDEVVTEEFPIDVTRAAEPVVEAETNAARFASGGRSSVVLRFGLITGHDENSRLKLKRAATGKPIGMGPRVGWCHVIHPDDLGDAVAAAIAAPGGIYNAGAAPIRREDLNDEFAFAAGRSEAKYYPKLVLSFAGEKLEMLTRSQRVSSQKFTDLTGWKPAHESFSADWLAGHG